MHLHADDEGVQRLRAPEAPAISAAAHAAGQTTALACTMPS